MKPTLQPAKQNFQQLSEKLARKGVENPDALFVKKPQGKVKPKQQGY